MREWAIAHRYHIASFASVIEQLQDGKEQNKKLIKMASSISKSLHAHDINDAAVLEEAIEDALKAALPPSDPECPDDDIRIVALSHRQNISPVILAVEELIILHSAFDRLRQAVILGREKLRDMGMSANPQ